MHKKRLVVAVPVAVALMTGACGSRDTGGRVGGDEAATTIGPTVPPGSLLLNAALPGGLVRVRLDPPTALVCADASRAGVPAGTELNIREGTAVSPGQVLVTIRPPATGRPTACTIASRPLFDQVAAGPVVLDAGPAGISPLQA